MKNKIIYLNTVPQQFAEHQTYIEQTIADLFTAFSLTGKLSIKFINAASTNTYEITDCLLKNIAPRQHELLIMDTTLASIGCDGGKFFYLAIYHEFTHIEDYDNMMQTKLFHFNLGLAKQKDFDRTYVQEGFHFWTEINAYYQTLMFAETNNFTYENITFGSLVTYYRNTVALNKSLYYKQDLTCDEASKYVKAVDSWLYLCAKYMAAVYAKYSRVPYAKAEQNGDYRKVYTIICGLEPKVRRLLRNPYGVKADRNLWLLGKYLCENIRWKLFRVGLIKKHGRVYSMY